MMRTAQLSLSQAVRCLVMLCLLMLAMPLPAAEAVDWKEQAREIHQRINREPGQVLQEIDHLIEKAEEEQETALLLDLLADKAWAARLMSQYETAIAAAEKGIEIATQFGDQQRLASLYNNLAGVYWSLRDYGNAMDFWTRTLKIRERLQDEVGVAKTLNNIALIYQSRGELDKAAQWMRTALQTALRIDSKLMQVVILGNLGDLETGNQRFDTAGQYYEKAERLAEETGDTRARQTLAVSRAYWALQQGKLQEAEQYLDRAWALSRILANKRKEIEILQMRADLALLREQTDAAIAALLQAEQIAKTSGRIEDQIQLLDRLATLEAERENWPVAYRHLRKELDLSNRWLEKQKENTLLSLQTRFEWEDQQRKLKALELNQTLLEKENRQEVRQQQLLLFALIFFALLVLVLAWMLRQKIRLNAVIEAKNAELEAIRRVLQEQARIDPLTHLYNRRAFMEKIQQEIKRMQRTGHSAGLVLLDLDHFKQVNDQFGHVAGDMILQGVAARMRNVLREVDVLARWGGEEFIIMMPDTDLATASRAAERLRQHLSAKPYRAGHQKIPVTVTLGVTAIRPDCDDFQAAYHAVDQALYQGKAAGRNRVVTQSCFCEQSHTDGKEDRG